MSVLLLCTAQFTYACFIPATPLRPHSGHYTNKITNNKKGFLTKKGLLTDSIHVMYMGFLIPLHAQHFLCDSQLTAENVQCVLFNGCQEKEWLRLKNKLLIFLIYIVIIVYCTPDRKFHLVALLSSKTC